MDMFSTVANEKSSYDIEPIEDGLHAAKCIGVFGIGTHLNSYGNNVTQTVVMFAIDQSYEYEDKETKEKKIVNKKISKFYTNSLSEKATLRKDLEKWRGKPFTKEELEGFDISKVLGQACILDIKNEVGADGKNKDKITAITKMNDKYKADIPNVDIITEAPEWIQKKRSESLEAKCMPTKTAADVIKEETAKKESKVVAEATTEDIPF